VLITLLATGCSKPPTAEQVALDKCKGAILAKLIDPESARFTEPMVVDLNSGRNARFIVNSKNRMGGYSGREPFICEFDAAGEVSKVIP